MKFLLAFVLIVLSVQDLLADETDRESAQFFDSVMSPYCPGMTLSACPSDDARILRDEVRAQFGKGESREKILADLRVRFGNLSGGPAEGAMNKMAYLGVLVFFVIGFGIIVLNIRKNEKGNNVQTET